MWGETLTVNVSFRLVPEILLKICKSHFARLEIYKPVISGHLTFEVETSTRSQNVQQTAVTAHIISAQ